MEPIVKEIYTPSRKYKAVIIKREKDSLFESTIMMWFVHDQEVQEIVGNEGYWGRISNHKSLSASEESALEIAKGSLVVIRSALKKGSKSEYILSSARTGKNGPNIRSVCFPSFNHLNGIPMSPTPLAVYYNKEWFEVVIGPGSSTLTYQSSSSLPILRLIKRFTEARFRSNSRF